MKEVRVLIEDDADLLNAIKAMAKLYKQRPKITKLPDIDLTQNTKAKAKSGSN